MKVLHYYPAALFGTGGVSESSKGWALGMASAGADVVVASDGGRYGPSDGPFEWADVGFHSPKRLARPAGLEGPLAEADLLVLHSGWTLYNIWAARIARAAGTPYVITPHGSYAPNIVARSPVKRTLWLKTVERNFLRDALAIHLFFEDEHEAVRALGYKGPLITAPNAVTVPMESTWDGGSGGYFLWMGRFDITWKGLDLLMTAAEQLDGAAKLRLHGPESPEKDEVRRLVQDRGLRDVVLVGEMLTGAEKWATLQAARGFVFSSRWDAHSIAVMEAAALGVPVIASNTTAVGRMLGRHDACWAVSPKADRIAEAIGRLAIDDEGLGARARQLVQERFTWPTVGASFLNQAKSLL